MLFSHFATSSFFHDNTLFLFPSCMADGVEKASDCAETADCADTRQENYVTLTGQLLGLMMGLHQMHKWRLNYYSFRAVFKWLSKVITWLRLLRLVIGLKESRQFFDAKPKAIASRTRDSPRASSELQVIARNCDWFIALFVPVVIGRSNCFGFDFSTLIWKPLHLNTNWTH